MLLLPCGKDDKGRGCISLSLHLPLNGCSMQRGFRLLLDPVQAWPGRRGRAAALGSCNSHLPMRLCRHLA